MIVSFGVARIIREGEAEGCTVIDHAFGPDFTPMALDDPLHGRQSDAGAPDSSADQARASELVAANRLYRQSASQAGEASLASILDELERVLIEIANQPPDVTRGELREMRRRIDEEDLLFKIRVLSSQVRSREKKDSSKSLL
jgi:hypothetical protein